MEIKKLNVSAILCVYNEIKKISIIEKNINNHPFSELIIVDGGSNDGTFEKLSTHKNILLYRLENAGLLSQRLFGINKSSESLLFMFNADDDITSLNMKSMVSELLRLNADGLQIRILSKDLDKYWTSAWSEYFDLIFPINIKLKCLGRPCLTYKRLFDIGLVNKNIFNEDTYLRYEQELRYGELSYFSSEQSIFREMPEGIRLNIIQFIRYGQSDMVIAENNLKIFFDLLYHSLIRISIIRSINLMLKGKFKYTFFTIIMGLFRGFSLLYYKIKK